MKYIIISPAQGSGKKPMFWRANAAGYTYSPFAAGIYDEKEIKERPDYYNNGYSSVAIPLTDKAMSELDFTCSYNDKALDKFLQVAKKVNPPQGNAALNNMEIILDPKDAVQEEAQQEQAADTQATEQAAEEKAEGDGALVD